MKSNEQIKVCKLCFKEIRDEDLFNLVHNNNTVCQQCYKEIKPIFQKFNIDGYQGLSIYRYSEKIQSLIYQFKGCFDYELKDLFLERFSRELTLRYKGYVVVPIPSYEKDDEVRGFNHVEEMFKILKLPTLKIISKTKKVKQADRNKMERKNIGQYLVLKEKRDLSNTKVLLVDDVFTTGSTMKACIKLIEKLNPKKIKVLVISKTENH